MGELKLGFPDPRAPSHPWGAIQRSQEGSEKASKAKEEAGSVRGPQAEDGV